MPRHYAEVEFDLNDFSDEELLTEIRSRELIYDQTDPLVYELFLEYTSGRKEEFEKTLKKLFLDRLGKRV